MSSREHRQKIPASVAAKLEAATGFGEATVRDYLRQTRRTEPATRAAIDAAAKRLGLEEYLPAPREIPTPRESIPRQVLLRLVVESGRGHATVANYLLGVRAVQRAVEEDIVAAAKRLGLEEYLPAPRHASESPSPSPAEELRRPRV